MPYRRHYIGDFEKCRRDHPDWPVVMSEGDSWFSYSNIVGRMDQMGNAQRHWSLLRVEKNGDEILTIMSGSQRSKLRKWLSRWQFDALLFSGGGNDIIGPDLLPLLRPYLAGMQAEDVIAFSRFERRARQVQDCYRELLDMMRDANQSGKVFVNSYDYAIPSDKPVKLLGLVDVSGPWMLPHFQERSIPEPLRGEVVKLLIDGFAAAIDVVAAEPRGFGTLVRVETRGVLGAGDWRDEIHPRPKGASMVAKAFVDAMATAGVAV